MSANVELTTKEIYTIVSENALKMLFRRKTMHEEDNKENREKNDKDFTSLIEKIQKEIQEGKSIFEFNFNKGKYSFNIITSKLTSIVQGTPLDDYLSNNLDVHKFVIARDVAKKVVKQIMTDYQNAEFFFEQEMLEDIPSKVYIPQHHILSKEEKEELLKLFKDTDFSRIHTTDVMSRYYAAKPNDIIRIIRPSITSGKSVFYRRVVVGSIDQLFEN